MTVRVPSENLESFLYGVASIGYITEHSSLDIEDKSLLYLENNLKQKARTTALAEAPVNKNMASTVKSIAVKDDAIEKGIANRQINADVQYSVVNLQLFQSPVVRKEMIANYAIDDYMLPFAQRLGNALKNGWSYFTELLLALTNIWVFILLALGVWIIINRWKRVHI